MKNFYLILITSFLSFCASGDDLRKENCKNYDLKESVYNKFEKRAQDIWFSKGNTHAYSMDPVAIRFPDRVCVQLKFVDGSLGGEPVYCFNESLEVVEKHERVE